MAIAQIVYIIKLHTSLTTKSGTEVGLEHEHHIPSSRFIMQFPHLSCCCRSLLYRQYILWINARNCPKTSEPSFFACVSLVIANIATEHAHSNIMKQNSGTTRMLQIIELQLQPLWYLRRPKKGLLSYWPPLQYQKIKQ